MFHVWPLLRGRRHIVVVLLHLSSEFLSKDIVLWGSLELCHRFLTARGTRTVTGQNHGSFSEHACKQLYILRTSDLAHGRVWLRGTPLLFGSPSIVLWSVAYA